MTESVIVSRLYTTEDALEVCKALVAAGLDAECIAPFLSGNFLVDWSTEPAEYQIAVPAAQAVQARAVIDGLIDGLAGADADDESDGVVLEIPSSSEPAVFEPDGVSMRITRALRASILALVTCLAVPVAFWMILSVGGRPSNRRDAVKFWAAIAITLAATIIYSFGYSIMRWPYPRP